MHELTLGSAFVAGLLGSTHCVVMCGGIATALGTQRQGPRAPGPLLYQLGRVSSYGTAGAWSARSAPPPALRSKLALERSAALGTALIVVLIGLDIALGAARARAGCARPSVWGALLWRRIAPLASRLPAPPALRALTLGMLWGWLPCGLVYSVLLAAAFAGSALGGAATMIAFGLGTLPAMLGLSYAAAASAPPALALARLLGAVIVACGLWTASMPIAILFGAHQHVHSVARASSYKDSR